MTPASAASADRPDQSATPLIGGGPGSSGHAPTTKPLASNTAPATRRAFHHPGIDRPEGPRSPVIRKALRGARRWSSPDRGRYSLVDGLRRTRVPHVEGFQPRKADLAPRGRAGYHRSIATILTESEPLGASKDTVSPTVAPSSASPSGDPGDTTPTSSRCSSMEPTSIRSGSSSPS